MADADPVPGGSKLRLSLCLLTWNEIDGCRHDVPSLPLDEFEEVYAIDGGSTDGTVEYLQSRGIETLRQAEPGYNQAYLSAFARCATDAVVLFHPKGSIAPMAVRQFRAALEAGNDVVVASRLIRGGRNEEDDRLLRPRKWFVLGLALLAALLWRRRGPIVWDVLHGCRAVRRTTFFALDPLPEGLSIDLEIVVRGYRKRYRMAEFPVEEQSRLSGKTRFPALRTGRRLIGYVLRELRRKA